MVDACFKCGQPWPRTVRLSGRSHAQIDLFRQSQADIEEWMSYTVTHHHPLALDMS